MNIKKVHEHIDLMKDEDFKTWVELVSQPSISAQGVGMRECATLIKKLMDNIGIKTTLFETSGYPIIFGELKTSKKNASTIIFYGHYDVQPPEPLDEWDTPPFEPSIRNGRLYGRGTGDNKGQFLAHLFAVRSYLETNNDLPVNVKFVLDGEEESGSPYLQKFVESHLDILDADILYNADGIMHESGAPLIYFGHRGVVRVELTIETATKDNHSGNKGGLIPNAAWEMVKLLSTMIDNNGKVIIPGFYDTVLPPAKYDLELIDSLLYDPKTLAKEFGVKRITLNKRDFYSNLMLQPTLTINGIGSGYIGNGMKAVIPGKAMVKLDIKLVADQDPDDIFKKVKDHVKDHVNEHDINVNLLKHSVTPVSRTRTDLPISKVIVEAVQEAYQQKAFIMPLCGATNPSFVWTKILGIPYVMVAYGNYDEQNHAPNENMVIDLFYKGIHCSAQVLYKVGQIKK